jgi:hypothetical protein
MLSACDEDTVTAVERAVDEFSRPFIASSIQELLHTGRAIAYDLDLLGQAVSATSTSYPATAFGWMDDAVKLGYQLARVCLTRPDGSRIWLAGFHHPGNTVSVSCPQELVRAAEQQTGVRPRRRTGYIQRRVPGRRAGGVRAPAAAGARRTGPGRVRCCLGRGAGDDASPDHRGRDGDVKG